MGLQSSNCKVENSTYENVYWKGNKERTSQAPSLKDFHRILPLQHPPSPYPQASTGLYPSSPWKSRKDLTFLTSIGVGWSWAQKGLLGKMYGSCGCQEFNGFYAFIVLNAFTAVCKPPRVTLHKGSYNWKQKIEQDHLYFHSRFLKSTTAE